MGWGTSVSFRQSVDMPPLGFWAAMGAERAWTSKPQDCYP
jgi:hypothetical protein